MTRNTKFSLRGPVLDAYLKPVTAFPLTSIKSDEPLQEAQKVTEQLLAQGELKRARKCTSTRSAISSPPTRTNTTPIEPASAAEIIGHLMEAKAVTQAQLSQETTVPKSTISEILAGKKHLSRRLVRKFADDFQVDVSVLATSF